MQEFFRKKVLTGPGTYAILYFTCERGFFVARFSLFKPRWTGPGREADGLPPEEGEYKEVPKQCESK